MAYLAANVTHKDLTAIGFQGQGQAL